MHSKLLVAAFLLGSVGAASTTVDAADGIQIVQRVTSGGAPMTTQMQIENTRMRTEIADGNGGTQVVVFDGGKQALYIINAGRKTYSEVTKADVERLKVQMQSMMAQMQAAMEKVPPAQRAQMEALMKGRGMAAAGPAKVEYKRAGADKVGRWACDKYEGMQNGQKVVDICTVDPSLLGGSAQDYEVTRQMADFFSGLAPQVAQQIAVAGRAETQGFNGFPVRTTVYVGGNAVTTEVVEAGRQTFAESLFTVPAGFTKQDLFGPTGAGR